MHNRQGGMAFTLRTMVHVRGKDSVSTMMRFESFELAVGKDLPKPQGWTGKRPAKEEIEHGENRSAGVI